MARTNSGLVQGVLAGGRDYDAARAPSLEPYIAIAGTLTDQVVACAAEDGTVIDAAVLVVVETWLAAHFYQQSDKGYASRTTERASGVFQGRTDKGLDSTFYGQSAMRADPSGCLRAIDAGRLRAGGSWLGKTEVEAVDYRDRN